MGWENMLKEVLKELVECKRYVDLVSKDDIANMNKVISNVYDIGVWDCDQIKEKIYELCSYVEMKKLNDCLDLDKLEEQEEY